MSQNSSYHGLVKLLYLLALTGVMFFVHTPVALIALVALQVMLWLLAGLELHGLWRTVWRLRLFFILIALSYAFLPTGAGGDRWLNIPLAAVDIPVNLDGLMLAAVMCLRVLALVIASGWVQRTLPPGGLTVALQQLRVPRSLAIVVDASLYMIGDGGQRPRSGGGKGTGQGRMKQAQLRFAQIRRGDLSFIHDLVNRSFGRAEKHMRGRYPDLPDHLLHDLSIALAISLAILGLKLIQVLPGLPIASGHKNLLIVPLLLFAARTTHMRFGGLLAGTGVGVVSFLLGYGKYGVLEIAHFAVPGLLADLLITFARAHSRGGRLLQFALIGTVLGAGRFAANFLVIVLAGAPQLAFVFFAPMLISQLVFGALSCLVSLAVVPQPGTKQVTFLTEPPTSGTEPDDLSVGSSSKGR